MKKILLSVALLLATVISGYSQPTLNVSEGKIIIKDGLCDVKIQYPVFRGFDEFESVADSVNAHVRRVLDSHDMLEVLFDLNDLNEVPSREYTYSRDTDWIGKWSDRFICIELVDYIYAGGAHGNSQLTSLLFDAATGRKLNFMDLVTDKEALRQAIIKNFKEQYKECIDPESEEVSILFMPISELPLPESFLINSDRIVAFYNQYEVAPYAAGVIEVEISFDQIKGLIKADFSDLMPIPCGPLKNGISSRSIELTSFL